MTNTKFFIFAIAAALVFSVEAFALDSRVVNKQAAIYGYMDADQQGCEAVRGTGSVQCACGTKLPTISISNVVTSCNNTGCNKCLPHKLQKRVEIENQTCICDVPSFCRCADPKNSPSPSATPADAYRW